MHLITQSGSDIRKNLGRFFLPTQFKIISIFIPPGSPMEIAIGKFTSWAIIDTR